MILVHNVNICDKMPQPDSCIMKAAFVHLYPAQLLLNLPLNTGQKELMKEPSLSPVSPALGMEGEASY